MAEATAGPLSVAPVLNEHVARKKPDEAEIEKQKSKACKLRAAPNLGDAAGQPKK